MTEQRIAGQKVDNTNLHWLLRIALAKQLITPIQCVMFNEISTLDAWLYLESLGVSQQKTLETILSYYSLEQADFSKIDPDVTELLDAKTSRTYNIVPLYSDNYSLAIATVDPFDNETEHFLRFVSGRFIQVFITTPDQIAHYFDNKLDDSITNLLSQIDDIQSKDNFQADVLTDDVTLPFVIRLVNTIIVRAVAERVSDIHILHNSAGCDVRFRVDGVLHEGATIPMQIAENVLSRFKVMAGVDISNNLLPSDGRAKLYAGGRLVDLRFNFVPTVDGKKATIRIQDSRQRKQLSELGYGKVELEQFTQLISAKIGLILVTGPTGSGKTNTLYAALDHIYDPSKNIISIEDPVEFSDKSITQLQVNNKTGFSFATGLRAAMRQDPDIIMVGEIRDKETAQTALQASETGHLVLSTLHSRSAVGAILRLLELGANRGLLVNSITGIVAQRLLRKLCHHCSKPVAVETLSLPESVKALMPKNPTIRQRVGCPYCHQSGYFGRIAIAEILQFTPKIRFAIDENKSLSKIERLARSQGMRLLDESAIEHFFAGRTTLEEIARVLDILDIEDSKLVSQKVYKTKNKRNIKQVLLIYSDMKMAEMLKQQLSHYDFVVTITHSNQQAEAYIAKEDFFDLVICELKATNIDAHSLISLIREQIEYAATPILIISEANQDEEAHKLIELGANDYVSKPINFTLLFNRIMAVLKRTSLS